MTERSADGRLIVRVVPDLAGTVLWSGGVLDHADACLSPGLEADLRAWEACHRTRLDPGVRVHDPADARAFARTGAALADRPAGELGDGVEVHLVVGGRTIHWSSGPPTNPRAARALHDRAAQAEAEAREIAARHPDGGWYAYAPLSGTRFRPSRGEHPSPGTHRPPD